MSYRIQYTHLDGTAAIRWLRVDEQSPRGDRKAPTPAGAPLRGPLEIYGG